jgi:exopolysaccharide biosynthesis polyprenyl glycosylphosphotransferase
VLERTLDVLMLDSNRSAEADVRSVVEPQPSAEHDATAPPARPEPSGPRRLGAKLVLGATDLAVVVLTLVVAYALRSGDEGPDLDGARAQHLLLGLVSLPIWLGAFSHRRLYNSRFIVRRLDEWRRIAGGTCTTVFAMAAIGYVLQLDVSRAWLLYTIIVGVPLLAIEREVARMVFARLRCSGRMLRNVVIVGSNDEARELADMFANDPTLGYRVVGFATDSATEPGDGLRGTVRETLGVVERTGAGGVVLATSATSAGITNPLVRELLHAGVHVEMTSTLRDIAPDRLTVRALGRFPVMYLEPRHPAGWRSVAKRAFDIVLALAGLVLVAPFATVVALAIKIDSRGPVLFKQKRVGQHGSTFRVWKFRTMVTDAERLVIDLRDRNEAEGPLFKMKDDPRVTRVGRILRKTSLDELPQLVNVLRGEMSLVGPRPALHDELAFWDRELHARLQVKPGITGMWQVSGRSDSSFEDYSRLDLYYVDNWSLATDVTILAKTVPAVLFGRGAY